MYTQMEKTLGFGIRVGTEYIPKLDKKVRELGTNRSKYCQMVVEASLDEESVHKREEGGKIVHKVTPILITTETIQQKLDELYKKKQKLKNGVEMPGTYITLD